MAAEPANYISLRAVVEQKTPFTVLRELSAELLDTVPRIDETAAGDHELAAVSRGFIQGYVEFHVRTPHYRLGELGVGV
ncbi:hypothetical protein A0H81_13340 [Grifola frondosa]|uniref:Uncharacterized protein n=1 Tax=Grifola frondosa TaxID=5627 RepID=A0A1C7LQQ8_GRIFR|nr:hypothetical protein A0H81_13340 [Grifola frondosa]